LCKDFIWKKSWWETFPSYGLVQKMNIFLCKVSEIPHKNFTAWLIMLELACASAALYGCKKWAMNSSSLSQCFYTTLKSDHMCFAVGIQVKICIELFFNFTFLGILLPTFKLSRTALAWPITYGRICATKRSSDFSVITQHASKVRIH